MNQVSTDRVIFAIAKLLLEVAVMVPASEGMLIAIAELKKELKRAE